jgi:peptide/nickel transport system permease protein
MTLKDRKDKFMEFWNEYKKVKFGLVGLAFLIILLLLIIFEPLIVPFEGATEAWSDIAYWQDYPQNSRPVWTNFFSKDKRTPSVILEDFKETELPQRGQVRFFEYEFEYDYNYDIAPKDMILRFKGDGKPFVTISIIRPDGKTIDLIRNREMIISSIDGARVSIQNNSGANAYNFASNYESAENLSGVARDRIDVMPVIMSKADVGITKGAEALKGTYTIKISAILREPQENIEKPIITMSGAVSGLMGTDNQKRDLFTGIILGIKWALLIGLLTSFVSITIGVIYGVICAYFGGIVDVIMQRIFEIFYGIPMLPLLIVVSAIFSPSIWLLIAIMGLLYWVGPVKTVRSIGLQIREETFIEASQALGAGHFRLIFKHMVPLLLPYTFASMALLVPGAIVAEATISLLGLGDTTIVSWGQILNSAFRGGAIINGYWWWVVPPGLMIAITGMTFAFIGFAMDKILHPKLKSR